MTGRSVKAPEQLTSVISRGAMALVRQPKSLLFFGRYLGMNISYTGSKSVK